VRGNQRNHCRYVSAWGHLRNAVYDSTRPFSWQGQTMVHMTADEYGLYVVYPAHDEYDPYSASPAYVINKINPHDLKTIGFWKTSMRRFEKLNNKPPLYNP